MGWLCEVDRAESESGCMKGRGCMTMRGVLCSDMVKHPRERQVLRPKA